MGRGSGGGVRSGVGVGEVGVARFEVGGGCGVWVVMGIGWIFIIDHRFKVNERLSTIIG